MQMLVLLAIAVSSLAIAQVNAATPTRPRPPQRVGATPIVDKLVVVTPCGNLTNNRYKYGVVKYNHSSGVASILCARGYTFSSAGPTRKCNKTSNTWIDSKKLKCVAGNVGRCPKSSFVGPCEKQCGNDTECGKNQKCCGNGCIYKCVSPVNDGLCGTDNKKARFKEALDKSAACTSEDKRNWCAEYYENITDNCMGIMMRRLPEIIDKMDTVKLKAMLEEPKVLKHLCKEIAKIPEKTLKKIEQSLSENNLAAFRNCLKGTLLKRFKNVAIKKSVVKILKKQFGELDKWKPDDIKGRAIVLCFLNKKDLKNLGKNKDINDIIKNIGPEIPVMREVKDCHIRLKLIVTQKYGSCDKWDSTTVKTLGNFVVLAPKNCITKLLPKKEFCKVHDELANIQALRRYPELVEKIVKRFQTEKCSGVKPLKEKTAAELQDMKSLVCGLQNKHIKELGKEKISFDLAGQICRCPEPLFDKKNAKSNKIRAIKRNNFQRKKAVLNKLKDHIDPSKWTVSDLPKILDCPLDEKTCKAVPKDVFSVLGQPNIVKRQDCVQAFKRSDRRVLKCVRDKIEEAIGKSNKTSECLAALKDFTFSSKDIKNNPKEAQKKVKMLLEFGRTLAAKKILYLAFKQGEVNFKNYLGLSLPCNLLKKYAAKLLEDIGLSDTALDAGQNSDEVEAMDVPPENSGCILEIYKNEKGSSPKSEEDLMALGSNIIKGLTSKNILDLLNKEAVYEFLQVEDLTFSQLVASIKKLRELKVKIDASVVCELGSAVSHLTDEELRTLPLESEEDCSLLNKLKDVDPVSLGKPKLEGIAKIIINKIGEKITKSKMEEIGAMILGFPKSGLEKLVDDAVPVALKIIAEYKTNGFVVSDDNVKYLVDRFRKISKDKFDGDDICDAIMPLCEFFEDVVDAALDQDTFNENKECITNTPVKVKCQDIIRKKLANSKNKRKRRDSDASLSLDEIFEKGLYITPEEISKVPFNTYQDNAEEIGKQKYNEEQLQAWAKLAKNGKEASQMTPDLIKILGPVCTGLTASDIGSLNFEDDETIQKCAEQKGFKKDQRFKGLEQVKDKKGKPISQFEEGELIALSNFLLALTPAEINSIPKNVYGGILVEFGKLSGWDEDQLVKLKDKAEETMGEVKTWTPNSFAQANAAIGGLSESEIKELKEEQIESFPDNAVSQIPASKLKHYSVEQLNHLSPKQSSAFTDEQKDALPDEIKKKVCQDTGGCVDKFSSGSSQVTMGMATLVILVTMTVLL